MAKIINALEIGSTEIKLVVGYECEHEIVVLHAIAKPLSLNCIKNNIVNDSDEVCSVIKEVILDAENNLKNDINEVTLVLPARGLEVFKNSATTNVVSPNKLIAEVDIRNVMTMLSRDTYNEENAVIDTIPINYTLDQERIFSNPPINETSGSIKLNAFIHTIPTYIKETYIGLVDKVGLKISNILVAPYGVAQLFTTYKNVSNKYFLVNVGGKTTTITIISDGKPYQSSYIDMGGENLTQELCYRMGISYSIANELKLKYGLDNFKYNFKPSICHSEQDKNVEFTVNDLRLVTEEYLNTLFKDINRAIKTLMDGDVELEQWPLVFVGGGTQLIGFKEFVSDKYNSRSVIFPSVKSLGARNQIFINCLGAIKTSCGLFEFIGDEKEEIPQVQPLTREKHKTQKYSETDDSL